MPFSFIDDPRWQDLDKETKTLVVNAAFEDQVVSDPRWSEVDTETRQQIQAAFFEDADAYSKQREPHADGFLGSLAGGVKQVANSVRTAANVVTNDEADVRELTQDASKILKTPQQQSFNEALQARKADDDMNATGWGSFKQGVSNVAGAALEEPLGALHEVAGQVPNAGVIIGSMWAGAKAGAMAGAMTANPVGIGVGGIAGGIVGALFGNVAIETGGIAQEQVNDGEYHRDDALKKGVIKGAVISAVDVASMGVSKALFTPAFKAANEASQKAIQDVLKASKINPFDDAAVKLALSQDKSLKNAVMQAGAKAASEAAPKGVKGAGLFGTGMAIDMAGEGVGEYYGSKIAGLDADATDAILEAAMSIPHGVAEVSIGKTLAKAKGILPQSVGGDVSNIGAAKTADEAVQAFESSVFADLDTALATKPKEAVPGGLLATEQNASHISQESDQFGQFQEEFRDQKIGEFEHNLKQAQADITEYPDRPPIQPDIESLRKEWEDRKAKSETNAQAPATSRRQLIADESNTFDDFLYNIQSDTFENNLRSAQADIQPPQQQAPIQPDVEALRREYENKQAPGETDSKLSTPQGMLYSQQQQPVAGPMPDSGQQAAKPELEPPTGMGLKDKGQQSFVDQRIQKLGSIDAVDKAYGRDDNVSQYARAKAREVFGQDVPVETVKPVEETMVNNTPNASEPSAPMGVTSTDEFSSGVAPTNKENLSVAPGQSVTWQDKKGKVLSGKVIKKQSEAGRAWQVIKPDGKKTFVHEKHLSPVDAEANNQQVQEQGAVSESESGSDQVDRGSQSSKNDPQSGLPSTGEPQTLAKDDIPSNTLKKAKEDAKRADATRLVYQHPTHKHWIVSSRGPGETHSGKIYSVMPNGSVDIWRDGIEKSLETEQEAETQEKQPWEMNLLEYGKSRIPASHAEQITDSKHVKSFSAQHRNEVKTAIDRGERVPKSVLEDHPDLARQYDDQVAKWEMIKSTGMDWIRYAPVEKSSDNDSWLIEKFVNKRIESEIKSGKERGKTATAEEISTYKNDLTDQTQKFVKTIRDKEFSLLKDRLHRGNPDSLKLFTELTGLSTKTQKETDESIRSLDPGKYDAWINDKKTAYEAKAKEKEAAAQAKAEKDMLSNHVQYNGERMSWEKYIKTLLKNGFTSIEKKENGPFKSLKLLKHGGDGGRTFSSETFKKKAEIEYIEKIADAYIEKEIAEDIASEDKDQAENPDKYISKEQEDHLFGKKPEPAGTGKEGNKPATLKDITESKLQVGDTVKFKKASRSHSVENAHVIDDILSNGKIVLVGNNNLPYQHEFHRDDFEKINPSNSESTPEPTATIEEVNYYDRSQEDADRPGIQNLDQEDGETVPGGRDGVLAGNVEHETTEYDNVLGISSPEDVRGPEKPGSVEGDGIRPGMQDDGGVGRTESSRDEQLGREAASGTGLDDNGPGGLGRTGGAGIPGESDRVLKNYHIENPEALIGGTRRPKTIE